MSDTVRYLSLEWIDELSRAVAADAAMAGVAADHEIGVTQVVSDGPEGDVTYHLQVDDGAARFGAGAAEPEHVRMEQTWDDGRRRRHRRAQRPGGVRQRPHPAVRRPAAAARRAAGVRRPRRRVHRRPRAHRVRLRSRRARDARGPGPRRAADRRLRRAPAASGSCRSRSPRSRPRCRRRTRRTGCRCEEVGRRGKYLLVRFEPITFVVHLMQGGRLLVDAKQSAKPRGGQARFVFDWTTARRCC